jgi:outer membrane murein-binding lipoprotein Lpp
MRLSALTALFAAVAVAGCTNPRTEANVASAINDAANEISGLKNDIALLQSQVDSLHTAVAKQDSLITRILAVSNIPR